MFVGYLVRAQGLGRGERDSHDLDLIGIEFGSCNEKLSAV